MILGKCLTPLGPVILIEYVRPLQLRMLREADAVSFTVCMGECGLAHSHAKWGAKQGNVLL